MPVKAILRMAHTSDEPESSVFSSLFQKTPRLLSSFFVRHTRGHGVRHALYTDGYGLPSELCVTNVVCRGMGKILSRT